MKGHNRWDAILRRLPEDHNIIGVEVGVWAGKLSERLLHDRPFLKLYMVDRWRPPLPGDSYLASGSDIATRPQVAYDAALAETHKRVAFAGKRAVIKIESSLIAAWHFGKKNKRFDFVFIDGDHSYDGVTRDLYAWWPLVKTGGFISGHDIDHPKQGEVRRAVDEFFHDANIELDDGRTWFVRKTE